MRIYNATKCWTVVVFVTALIVYLLTACGVVYPGASAQFVASIFYPEQILPPLQASLCSILQWGAVQSVDPTQGLRAMVVVNAILAALSVTFLFRLAMAAVQIACLWTTDFMLLQTPRVQAELSRLTIFVGIGVAMLGMVSLPLWSSATRPLSNTLATTLSMGMLMFAFGLRWRSLATYLHSRKPGFRLLGMMFAIFALATTLVILVPTLFVVSLMAILFGGWIMVKREVEGRLQYMQASALGVCAGVGISFLVILAWRTVFVTEVSTLTLWISQLSSMAPQWIGMFSSFEPVVTFLLFFASAALFFGTFPYDFSHFGRPFIGQFSILVLLVISFVQWPKEFSNTLGEPSTLATLGILMVMVNVGLVFGSWIRNWNDSHTHWRPWISRWCSDLLFAVCFGSVMVGAIVRNAPVAAGSLAESSLHTFWSELGTFLPDERVIWWKPESQMFGLLIQRDLEGKPLYPLFDLSAGEYHVLTVGESSGLILDKTRSFAARHARHLQEQEDVVVSFLRDRSSDALEIYLSSRELEKVQMGPLPYTYAEEMEAIVERLSQTTFASTYLGQRTIEEFRAQVARAYVTAAYSAQLQAAAYALYRARELNPKSVSARLGIGALPLDGYPISETDELDAIELVENDPMLRDPTPNTAIALAKQDGSVRVPRFVSAERLHRLLYVDPMAIVQKLCERYQYDRASLSERERRLAVLFLPEATVAQLWETCEPSVEELCTFLCVHPGTPISENLWKKYQTTTLAGVDGLFVLHRTKIYGTRKQLLDRAHTFFLHDRRFAYAYFYVTGLLEDRAFDDAITFVSSFNIQERLYKTPFLAEHLRFLVARALTQADPERAATVVASWLQKDPLQSTLWDCYLENPILQTDPARLEQVAVNCLQHFAFHARAHHVLTMAIRQHLGDVPATRYEATIQRARDSILNDKETYAHR